MCNKPYSHESLENDSLGGTESTIIRVAEGLQYKGRNIIVVQHQLFTPVTSPSGVVYAPWSWLDVVKPKNVIHVRTQNYVSQFANCNNIIWMHDVVNKTVRADIPMNDISGWTTEPLYVSVSDWHKQNLLSVLPGARVKRIYSPVDESFVNYPRPKSYDKNQLVWMSSPHKGLEKAIELFQELLIGNPEFKLVVFNPGYYEPPKIKYPRVAYLSKASRATMKSVISQSLCVFFPTQYEETFGMFAAEANALGTPVACYPVAALTESSAGPFAKTSDELLDTVVSWHHEGRSTPAVQPRFLFENIYQDWVSILS